MKEKLYCHHYVTRKEMIMKIMQGVFDPVVFTDWPHLKEAAKVLYLELENQTPNFSSSCDGLAIVEMDLVGIYRMSRTSFDRLVRKLEELTSEQVIQIATRHRQAA